MKASGGAGSPRQKAVAKSPSAVMSETDSLWNLFKKTSRFLEGGNIIPPANMVDFFRLLHTRRPLDHPLFYLHFFSLAIKPQANVRDALAATFKYFSDANAVVPGPVAQILSVVKNPELATPLPALLFLRLCSDEATMLWYGMTQDDFFSLLGKHPATSTAAEELTRIADLIAVEDVSAPKAAAGPPASSSKPLMEEVVVDDDDSVTARGEKGEKPAVIDEDTEGKCAGSCGQSLVDLDENVHVCRGKEGCSKGFCDVCFGDVGKELCKGCGRRVAAKNKEKPEKPEEPEPHKKPRVVLPSAAREQGAAAAVRPPPPPPPPVPKAAAAPARQPFSGLQGVAARFQAKDQEFVAVLVPRELLLPVVGALGKEEMEEDDWAYKKLYMRKGKGKGQGGGAKRKNGHDEEDGEEDVMMDVVPSEGRPAANARAKYKIKWNPRMIRMKVLFPKKDNVVLVPVKDDKDGSYTSVWYWVW